MSVSQPSALDLFSGCGGLSSGLSMAGIEVVGAVEQAEAAVRTYKLNFPLTQVWMEDIRHLSPIKVKQSLSLRRGDLFLLAACAPCQGFSRLSTRNGRSTTRDPRNSLVGTIAPFVETLLPENVILENVPAARASRFFSSLRGTLRRLGYKIKEDVVDLVKFGLPQHRRRYVVLASRSGSPSWPTLDGAERTVRDAIAGLPAVGTSGDPIHDFEWSPSEKVKQMVKRIPRDGGSRTDLPPEFQLSCHRNTNGFRDVYGRLSWDRPSVTITGGFVNPSKGRFLHPTEDRPLSPREASLLQGFSPKFAFDPTAGKYAIAEQIGNAVPPSFSALQAKALMRYV